LVRKHPKDPAVTGAAVRLAGSPSPDVRTAVIRQLGGWWGGRSPALTGIIRAATADPEAVVRAAAASALGSASDASHLDRLLPLWQDPDRSVRVATLRAVTRHTERRSRYSGSAEPVPRWTDEATQQAVLRYAENPAASFDERLIVARRIADPAALRASCRTLLPLAEQLPETPVPNGVSRKPRSGALALLAVRWVLADQYAKITHKDRSEDRFYLDRCPKLLERLTQCIAENRSDDATVAILREVANQPGSGRNCAEKLLHRREAGAASSKAQ
jgi:HEAT repeat protein